MKILILGHRGMLGHMVLRYLSTKNNLELITTNERWPSEKFMDFLLDFDGDFVVNCIGAIHQKTNEFKINVDLPIWLDTINKKYKIIHPGTDCESDNDEYGISKKQASEYLRKKGKDTKIIKASIIGPELSSHKSLLDWFLNSEGVVSGYTQAMWNGNTTLEWANACLQLINDWDMWDIETTIKSYCISKFELLKEIADVYETNTEIKLDASVVADKCLVKGKQRNPISIQLKELKEFYGY